MTKTRANFMENPVDICVISFSSDEENDHFDLIRRCLDSILENTNPQMHRLHIGCNNLSARVMAYVDDLISRHGGTKYIGEAFRDIKGNIVYPKSPLVRRIYAATHGDWVIHFDDDVCVTAKDWLERIEETINQNPDVDQFGIVSTIVLPPSVKEEWIDGATWNKPGKIQYKDKPDGRKIISSFILGGFYALSRKAIEACDIPDKRLLHNFDDWTTGMALQHNDFKMADFKYGFVIGDEPRRGIHDDEAISSNDQMVLKARNQGAGKTFYWEKVSHQKEEDMGKQQSISYEELPERFSMETLEKNLAALMTANEDLVRRICLPVDGSHIHFNHKGDIQYKKHRTLVSFTIDENDLPGTIDKIDISKSIFLFGIGLGEQLDYLLRHLREPRIVAWDRDPWLVRLVLMQKDYSGYLRSGQLQLHMCADLLDLVDMAKSGSVVCHPFLRLVYDNEYNLLEHGVGEKQAIICSGDLFVDEVGSALKGYGYSLYTLDIKKLSVEEMATIVRRFDPQVILAINYTNGLAEMCHSHALRLICWEVDPAADRLKPCTSPTDCAYIFTYKKANAESFVRAGFKNVEHLALASDIEKRFPTELSLEEKETYGSTLSFVGSSMIGQVKSFRDIFLSHYKAYCGGSPHPVEEGSRLLEEVLSAQRQDFSNYLVPDLLRQHCSGFINYLMGLIEAHDPFMLVGEIAAAEKRLSYVANLGRLGIKVWGDEGWRITEQYGIKYMGSAGHTHEINKIYSGSLINIDVNRIYQTDIVPMRVFDIMACGRFVLAEYSRDLGELFEIEKEVATYRTLDELLSKASYYLDHRDEALEIAERGQKAVLNKHTIAQRVQHMLNRMNPANWGEAPKFKASE